MGEDDGRELAATILDGTAGLADTVAAGFEGTAVGGAIKAGSAIAKIAASLVRKLGARSALKTLTELKARIDADDGVITDRDLEEDDAKVRVYIDDLFGPSAK